MIAADPFATERLILLKEGLDFAYYGSDPPNGLDPEVVMFLFVQEDLSRQGRLIAFLGEMQPLPRGDANFFLSHSGTPPTGLVDFPGSEVLEVDLLGVHE